MDYHKKQWSRYQKETGDVMPVGYPDMYGGNPRICRNGKMIPATKEEYDADFKLIHEHYQRFEEWLVTNTDIAPRVMKQLRELNSLKLMREAIEKEAFSLWQEEGSQPAIEDISKLHDKLNTIQKRITYLFNLKGVQKVLWTSEWRSEAMRVLHENIDPDWNYDKAVFDLAETKKNVKVDTN